MTAVVAFQILGVVATCIAMLYAALKRLFAPHLKAAIEDTISPKMTAFQAALEKHGAAMPELTNAIKSLTTATESQSTETGKLGLDMRELRVEVNHLAERTARIEGSISKPARRGRGTS
jgi:methyl-accepting chemotaxis protein